MTILNAKYLRVLLSLFLVAFSAGVLAQKAKSKQVVFSSQIMNYSIDEKLSSDEYVLTVKEKSSCDNSIIEGEYQTPTANQRMREYKKVVNGSKYFKENKDVLSNYRLKKQPVTHFIFEVDDLIFKNKRLENRNGSIKSTKPKKLYYRLNISLDANLKIQHDGDFEKTIVDTNLTYKNEFSRKFPNDFKFPSSNPLAKQFGYPTEQEIKKAWMKYRSLVCQQWRDELVKDFAKPIVDDFLNSYIKKPTYLKESFYTDKNRKGGYDNIVEASRLIESSFQELSLNFEGENYANFWTESIQNKLNAASSIYEEYLTSINRDVIENPRYMRASYRQEMLLNYLKTLAYTGAFDKFDKVYKEFIDQKIDGSIKRVMINVKRRKDRLEAQFKSNAGKKGWIRASDL